MKVRRRPDPYQPPPGYVLVPAGAVPSEPQLAGVRRKKRWGPDTRLGPDLRIKAVDGKRAAMQEIQPGMWIVTSIDENRVEGFGAVLSTLLVSAAAKALAKPAGGGKSPAQLAFQQLRQLKLLQKLKREKPAELEEPEDFEEESGDFIQGLLE